MGKIPTPFRSKQRFYPRRAVQRNWYAADCIGRVKKAWLGFQLACTDWLLMRLRRWFLCRVQQKLSRWLLNTRTTWLESRRLRTIRFSELKRKASFRQMSLRSFLLLSTTITRLCRCFCRETTQYHDLTSSRVSVQTASPSKTTILSKGRRRLKLLQNSNNKIKSEQFNLWRMGNPTLPTRTRVVTIPVSLVSHPHRGVLTVYLWIFNTQQFHSNVYKQFPQQNTYWFNNSLPYSTLLCCS